MAYRQRQVGRGLAIGLALLLSTALPRMALGNHHTPKEAEIKAAFLYNFTKFVAWSDSAPQESITPYVIAVLGDDPFGDALSALEKKTVQGRPIVVQNVSSLDSLKSCQMLFISSSEEPRLGAILRAAHARKILTVGDMEGFASRGGIIGLGLYGDRVGFEINVESARQAGLTISSRLLSLAKDIHRESGK
jgi:hypothetical protein